MDNLFFDTLSGQPDSADEEVSAQTRAKQLNLNYLDIKNMAIDEDTVALLPLYEAEEYRMIPFIRQGRILKVAAISMPLGAAKTRLVRLGQQTGYEIEVVIVSPSSLNYALKYHAQIIAH